MNEVAIVACGGAIGSVARFSISVGMNRLGASTPWPTMSINILGSLLVGVFYGFSLRYGWAENWRLFAVVGVLGGFTTFSAYSYESISLIKTGQWTAAILYITGSVILGLVACAVGIRWASP